jgi:hypothetical protein
MINKDRSQKQKQGDGGRSGVLARSGPGTRRAIKRHSRWLRPGYVLVPVLSTAGVAHGLEVDTRMRRSKRGSLIWS